MNDCKNKSMKEKEILFENTCNKLTNLFKYKKQSFYKALFFSYLFNCIGISYFKSNTLYEKCFQFQAND